MLSPVEGHTLAEIEKDMGEIEATGSEQATVCLLMLMVRCFMIVNILQSSEESDSERGERSESPTKAPGEHSCVYLCKA